MPIISSFTLAAASALLLGGQDVSTPIQSESETSQQLVPPSACCVVPARTPVAIEILDALSSKTSVTRGAFAFRLAEPLVVDGKMVAKAGTPGVGEVVHAAKARAGGKAGELILAARYLEIGGQQVRLRSLRYGASNGTDNSGAVATANVVAAAVMPIAGFAGFLVSGGNVEIPAGTRAIAQTAAEVVLTPIE